MVDVNSMDGIMETTQSAVANAKVSEALVQPEAPTADNSTITDATAQQTHDQPPTQAQPKSRALENDPLLQALIVLTKLFHRPFTADALISGLPLGQNESLTPALFIRAADRAGLTASKTQCELAMLEAAACPMVLLLSDARVAVLTELTATKATLILPDADMTATRINRSMLEKQYSGYCLLVKPQFYFSERTEDMQAKPSKQWFWGVINKTWPVLSEVLLASCLINLFALALPFFIMNVYDRVVPNNATETLWALAIGVFIVFCFDFILRNLRTYFIENTGKKVDMELSSIIHQHFIGLRMDARPPSVGVLANIVNAFDAFREFITAATISMIVDLPFTILFIAILYFIGGPIALVPLIAIPVIVLGCLAMQAPLRHLVKEAYRHSAEKQAGLYESLSQVQTVKTNNAESMLQRKWETLLADESKGNLKLRMLAGLTLSYAQFVLHLSSIILIIVGVYLIGDNLLSMGGLIACIILSNRALAPMSQVASLIARFYQSRASLNALDSVMQLPTERKPGASPFAREQLKGAIECRHLNFHYPDCNVPVLKDISFKLNPKDKVGLVGRIGSGKTTLEQLLVGLYQPSEGNILVDGIELSQLDPADLRRQVGYIPQDIELFYGSVRDNIALGAAFVDDAAVARAGKIAGVDEFVDTHPEGYARQVGERGQLLSGGQRQAIVVARAVLMDPPIIVMDEPTNLMDDKTEKSLCQRLKAYCENKTVILITHRASMLDLVDRLIVIDKGRLVADGSKQYVLDALSQGRVHTS